MLKSLRNLALALALLAATFAAPGAFAGDPPDYSGTWVLDIDASDSPDEYMKAQGASLLERKAVANIVVTLTIAQTPEKVSVNVSSAVKTELQEQVMDNTVRTQTTDTGPAQVKHYWGDSGEMISVMSVANKDGEPITQVTSRTVSGATMTQVISVTKADGSSVSMNRIFRKQ